MYQRIKDLREDKDKTQAEIAEIFDMQLTQYRRYENGEREPKLNFITKLADYYNVSIDYIAGRTNDKRGIGYQTEEKTKYNIKQKNNGIGNNIINIGGNNKWQKIR